MTAPAFAIGDRCLFATSCTITKESYGIAPHRRDVAQLVAPCTVVDLYGKKDAWPIAVKLCDGTTLVAVPNELTVLVPAEGSAFAKAVERAQLAPARSVEVAA